MMQSAFATLCQGSESNRPQTIEELLAGVGLLLPMLDVIPNAAIFIKDVQARYVLANRTLVQRCGLKDLQPLLGKPAPRYFPRSWGPAIPSRIGGCWSRDLSSKTSWNCTSTVPASRVGA